MFRVAKYLKRSLPAVLLVVLLLIVQAFCDLSLPAYTSDIVNVGIQQGGIEDPVPDTLRKDSLDTLLLLMPGESAQLVQGAYGQAENGVASLISGADREALSLPMGKSMLLASMLGGGSAELGEMQEVSSQLTQALGLPEGADPLAAFAAMPEEARHSALAAIYEKLDAIPESIVLQSAVSYVKAEYAAQGIDMVALQNNYILIAGLKMLGLALASMAATILVCLLAARISATVGRDLRDQMYSKVLSFSGAEIGKFGSASLITRNTNDVQQVQMLVVMMLRIVFYAPILGIGGIFKVFSTNTSMAWIIAVAFAAILLVVVLLFSFAMPKFKSMQKLVDKLNLVSREILTGLPVIRAFGTQRHEEKRFDKANQNLKKTNLFVNRTMSLMMPVMMLIMNLIAVLIVWNGAHSIDGGAMQVGDMMAFIQYTMQIIMAFLMISMVSVMLPRAAVSATRIDEVLATEPSVRDPQSPEPFDDEKKGVVEFKNVSFRYPGSDENTLSDISFTALPGQTTAFIGSTGSGKSSLVNLIPRFFDATEGQIFVDGKDVRRVRMKELRARLGYVPQKAVLFSGTIESNIKYSEQPVSNEAMQTAAEIAQATEFIDGKKRKFQSPISQGGSNVSGGQKQRLCIARAIAPGPEIYIFDDSFSALDFKTDAALRAALKEKTAGSTVLLVAQRIGTIMDAEQIIVLDEGRIAGKGTHKELLKSCDVYRQIALSQLSEEELA